MKKKENTSRQTAFRRIATTALSLLFLTTVQAQRESKTINDSWKFLQGECTTAIDSAFNDANWTSVHLPHTWNTDAYTEKDYYRGTGWYRRQISIPQSWKEKQIFLKLDAASKAATIYINGKKVGEHTGGYTACTFDITPFCSLNTPNSLAVCVDNARQNIPPISGDFTFFGGIYRDVWLTAVPKQHFHLTNYGSEGIFISTPQVSEEKGTILIRGDIKNDATQKASLLSYGLRKHLISTEWKVSYVIKRLKRFLTKVTTIPVSAGLVLMVKEDSPSTENPINYVAFAATRTRSPLGWH